MAKRAVVIGSGFGGLAAAARLRARGYQVRLLEALDQPGGRARVFERDGYTFDAGPTVITAPYLFEELFALFDKRLEDYATLVPVDPFYRVVFDDGDHFDYVGDEERLIEQIRRISPRDVEGYRKLAAHAERIFEVGYQQLADRPFSSITDMLAVIPAMMRLGSYRTVYGMVAKYIKDERLRQVFTFEPLLVGGNPFSTTSIYLLIHWLERKWGVHFAMGGTTTLVRALCQLLEEQGVEMEFSTPVARILTDASGAVTGVETEAGVTIPADVVVANADPTMVYGRMLDPAVRPRHSNRSLARKRQSMSLFVAYFGSREAYPQLAHHTILLGPRYKELLDDIFRKKVLAEDFSLYLHAPTRSDPSMAPPGKEGFYVLSPVPNNLSGIDWSREAEPYFQRIVERLDDRLTPGLKDNLESVSFLTPDDFEHTLRSADGAAFGLEPVLTQSAWFRYHNQSEDVPGLFFVGAGTHPGGGVPGVLSSAKVLDRVVPAA